MKSARRVSAAAPCSFRCFSEVGSHVLGPPIFFNGHKKGALKEPLFNALEGLPLALIRGANSELLTRETADEMARRRPDMLHTDVPDRGHVPFLDEPEALAIIHQWIGQLP